MIKGDNNNGYGPTQISETASLYDTPVAADFYRRDYVPAANGYRYLAARRQLRDRQPDPGYHLREHWRLALGFSVEHADGRVTPPPFPVLLWLWNSIKVAGITAIGIVALSTTCAYAFARMRFPGKATLLKGMLIFQMFPAVLSLVALYALFDRLGQYLPFVGLNTHGGVIFAYMGGIALHVWTIKGYFETIDGSLEEAAALDGATPWQAFRTVLLPLSVPILAVVFILSFIAAITEVPVASLLLRDVNSYTTAVGMQQYLNPQNYLWGDFAAAAVLSAIPITVVFLLAQRWLVNGLTAGGVKG